MYDWKDKDFGAAFDDLLDVFSGGANERFAPLLMLVRELDIKSANGDTAAKKVLECVRQVHRLINIAVKYDKEDREKSK